MGKHLVSILVGLVVVAVLASCGAPAAPAAPATPARPTVPAAPATPAAPAKPAARPVETIRLIDSSVGSTSWTYFTGMAFLAEKYSSWLRCEVVPTKGYAEGLLFLLQGKGPVTFTSAHLVTRANKGVKEYAQLGPRTDPRLVVNGAEIGMLAVVLDKSPIREFTYAALKGKKISTLTAGSMSADIMWSYLEAAGLDPAKDVKILYGSSADIRAAVLDGTADMVMHVTGMPSPVYEEMFMTKPCRLIPISKELTAKTNELMGAGLVPTVIPAGAFKGQREPVLTASVFALAFSLASVSEDIIYELTKLWWDHSDERSELHAVIAKDATVARLKAFKDVGFPWHPGALKYYRERGWF